MIVACTCHCTKLCEIEGCNNSICAKSERAFTIIRAFNYWVGPHESVRVETITLNWRLPQKRCCVAFSILLPHLVPGWITRKVYSHHIVQKYISYLKESTSDLCSENAHTVSGDEEASWNRFPKERVAGFPSIFSESTEAEIKTGAKSMADICI